MTHYVISNMFTGHRGPGLPVRGRGTRSHFKLDSKEARMGVIPVHLFDPSAEQPVTWHGSHFVAHQVRELIAIVKRRRLWG